MGFNKLKYDHIDNKWIDINCVNSIVTMSYNATQKIYTLVKLNEEEFEKFVTKGNVKVSSTRYMLLCGLL